MRLSFGLDAPPSRVQPGRRTIRPAFWRHSHPAAPTLRDAVPACRRLRGPGPGPDTPAPEARAARKSLNIGEPIRCLESGLEVVYRFGRTTLHQKDFSQICLGSRSDLLPIMGLQLLKHGKSFVDPAAQHEISAVTRRWQPSAKPESFLVRPDASAADCAMRTCRCASNASALVQQMVGRAARSNQCLRLEMQDRDQILDDEIDVVRHVVDDLGIVLDHGKCLFEKILGLAEFAKIEQAVADVVQAPQQRASRRYSAGKLLAGRSTLDAALRDLDRSFQTGQCLLDFTRDEAGVSSDPPGLRMGPCQAVELIGRHAVEGIEGAVGQLAGPLAVATENRFPGDEGTGSDRAGSRRPAHVQF